MGVLFVKVILFVINILLSYRIKKCIVIYLNVLINDYIILNMLLYKAN